MEYTQLRDLVIKTKASEWGEKDVYFAICKKPNNAQLKEIKMFFPPIKVDSLNELPNEYPYHALAKCLVPSNIDVVEERFVLYGKGGDFVSGYKWPRKRDKKKRLDIRKTSSRCVVVD